MFTRGSYVDSKGTYGVLMSHTKRECEVVLVLNNTVHSAFKKDSSGEYSFINKKAKEMWTIINNGLIGCKPKNGNCVPFVIGTSVIHEFIKSKTQYAIELYNDEMVACDVASEEQKVKLSYMENGSMMPKDIPYVKLSTSNLVIDNTNIRDEDTVIVRSVQEIALEKEDISWLKNKKYYIINDDEQAEKIFSYLDEYKGIISFDTETTGLRINCFGKINSDYSRQLIEYNTTHPDEQIRIDKLVGLIFCVEKDVSYYFPVGNRKFKNLYDSDSAVREQTIQRIKAKYMVGELATAHGDMAEYIRNTDTSKWTRDIVLMERLRHILETKNLVAHNGAFEWKVCWTYDIDFHLTDDTMVLHQIMYKFRGTTSNKGESSKLKYLAKVELGIDQWELEDFFPDYKEDDSGTVRGKSKSRKKKVNNKIDFSYMDYEGTKIYAPTDGDVTLQLLYKYKTDLVKNHKEQEYIYNVELVVACAIGYMEFYGHRIDESKIASVRDMSKAKLAVIESEIRQMIKYSSDDEIEKYNKLKETIKEVNENKNKDENEQKRLNNTLESNTKSLMTAIEENTDNVLNISSPAQVAELFYDKMEIPFNGDKRSVAKKEIKALLKAKNSDGSQKYPVVQLYSDYKKISTLLTKFFDNLPNFMFPGGIIFSHYGQISTATGRMSCSKPNAQQYPKVVAAMVSPRPNCVMFDADYSQIEYRVLTALAKEKKLAAMFQDPDTDYHTLMASLMYSVPYASVTPKMRGDAKSFNFGIPYGMGFKSLAILLTGMSGPVQIEEAKEKYELYFKDQPKTRKFFDQVKEMAQVNRYTKTFWNRYRYYSFEDKDGNTNEARKAAALRQAGNAVIQGSAADIFKISVARNFMYIRENKLLGLLLLINMIHDEMLFEVNVKKLNAQRVLRDVGYNMQFKVDGFPPLYIGAGFGESWGKAKGKMTEIHPHLLDKLSEEALNIPLYSETENDEKEVLDYIAKRIIDFRRNKVIDYLNDCNNYGKDLHPAIGNLINLQFTFGHNKEKEGLSDEEFTTVCLEEFIKQNNINVTTSMFKTSTIQEEEVEDKEYSDDENEEEEEIEGDVYDTDFALVDESNIAYGSSVQDMIGLFGCVVSKNLRLCGIDMRSVNYIKKEALIEFLCNNVCDSNDDGSMQVVFLQSSNILVHTGIWVKNIEGSEIEARIKIAQHTA